MSRFVFGPAIGPVELMYIPPAEPGVKVDVEVAFAGFTPDGEFHFELPAYDPAAHNLLAAVHVVLVADGTPVPTDPAAAVASPALPHYSTDTSTLQGRRDRHRRRHRGRRPAITRRWRSSSSSPDGRPRGHRLLALGVLLCVCSAGSILGWHRRNA